MPSSYDQLILFGDSITQMCHSQERGWAFAPALEEAYARRLDIVNRGLSGYNTDKAVKVLHKIIPSLDDARVRLMTIFFGANDACIPEADTRQHVPLDRYIQNIKAIISYPQAKGQSPHIVLITPPPICEHILEPLDAAAGAPLRRRATAAKAYADAVRQLGSDLHLPVLDMWSLFMEKTGWKEGDEPLPGSREAPKNQVLADLMYDGLHLSPPGYRILLDNLLALIAKEWPDLEPSKMSSVLPDWDDDSAWKSWSG